MKKIFITLLVLAVLAGGAVAAASWFLNSGNVEQLVKNGVKDKTGRDLSFSGVSLRFFPTIALRLENVAFSNPPWAKDKNMAEIASLDLRLALQPLFQRRVEVKQFILKSPVIHLETAADGKTNWDFSAADKKAGEKPAASGASGGAKDFAFRMGEFRIADGILSFADARSKSAEKVEDVDVNLHFPDLQSAAQADGALTWRGKRVDLELELEKPMAMAEGKTSPGHVSLKTEDLSFAADGTFASQGTYLKGDVTSSISSLPRAMAWLQGGAEQKLPFTTVSFKSAASLSASQLQLDGAALKLDDIEAKGDVSVGLSGRPGIRARLALNKIDLDRFTGGGKAGSGAGASSGSGQEAWDDTPIDFSGLKKADADVVLETQGFSLRGVDVGPSTLKATLQNGSLHATSSPASLFGGTFGGDLTVTASGGGADTAFKFDMTGVEAKPVLETFAHFKKLSGKADAGVSVTSSGNSQKTLVGNLAGSGSVTFKNGALEGIDLVNIAQMLQRRLTDMNVGGGKTEFVEMGGTFTVAQGVAANDDLKMRGPLVQATGQGKIDLPRKALNYRVIPVLTASSAVEGAQGLSIPVDIAGPFSNIKVRPDYASAVKQALDNPDAIKGTVKDAAKNVRDQGRELKGILKDAKKDPAKALEGLLGGGFLGGAPAAQQPASGPAPEPASAPAAEGTAAPEGAPAPAPAPADSAPPPQ